MSSGSPTPASVPEYNYSPPATVNSNQNVDVQALIAQLRAAGVQIVEPPVQLSPEEAARKAIENGGAGLGIKEQLDELYRHLDTIARKVGI